MGADYRERTQDEEIKERGNGGGGEQTDCAVRERKWWGEKELDIQ